MKNAAHLGGFLVGYAAHIAGLSFGMIVMAVLLKLRWVKTAPGDESPLQWLDRRREWKRKRATEGSPQKATASVARDHPPPTRAGSVDPDEVLVFGDPGAAAPTPPPEPPK